jgi:hypothetical protein
MPEVLATIKAALQIALTRIRRITHKSVGPEARFRYYFQQLIRAL